MFVRKSKICEVYKAFESPADYPELYKFIIDFYKLNIRAFDICDKVIQKKFSYAKVAKFHNLSRVRIGYIYKAQEKEIFPKILKSFYS